ncbi:hypothetical protein DMC30DRAFT_191631 [Rhodotorula diobovata]|uniref:Uncharacterized protein n=1 Tax=Rhodotorula diobovata TaxID=5288 RepID=A0A5C5G754_9BASI|nr:hypothetical protein DMC30DRAFT_191631 [Rhodotorula diobovata]
MVSWLGTAGRRRLALSFTSLSLVSRWPSMPRSAVDRVMRSDQPRRPPHWRQLVTLPSPSRSTSTVGALATAAGGLVSPIVPSLAAQHYHDHEPIVRELERRIRLFIAHFDKSRSWRFVVPGADKPWPGHIVIPKPNRNGALHKGSTVMVWDANVLVTSIVNNAIVPLMTLPVIDSKVNQLVVEHKDGLSDLWVYERVELDGLRRPFHAHWTLQDFRGQNVKRTSTARLSRRHPRDPPMVVLRLPRTLPGHWSRWLHSAIARRV